MKKSIIIIGLGFIVLTAIFHSCKKKELPILTTSDVTNITLRSATSGGNISDEGSDTIIARGVCWGRRENPTIADYKTIDGYGLGWKTQVY